MNIKDIPSPQIVREYADELNGALKELQSAQDRIDRVFENAGNNAYLKNEEVYAVYNEKKGELDSELQLYEELVMKYAMYLNDLAKNLEIKPAPGMRPMEFY